MLEVDLDALHLAWLGGCVAAGAYGIVLHRRREARMRPVREQGAPADMDYSRKCGFVLRRPRGLGVPLGMARVLINAETLCVRAVVVDRSLYCIERADAGVEYRRVQGVRGLRFTTATLELDLVVDDLSSFVAELEMRGWRVGDPDRTQP